MTAWIERRPKEAFESELLSSFFISFEAARRHINPPAIVHDHALTMTIFPNRRDQPTTTTPSMSPAPIPRAESATRVDENVFEHIIFPQDDDAQSSQSDICTLGSENEWMLNHSSSSASKSGSEAVTTPSASSGDARSGSFDEHGDECTTTKARAGSAGCRFSREARSVLRTWYHEHRSNPYPSSEEKDLLCLASGLKRPQISLWLANTRRKDRARQNEKQKQAARIPQQQTFSEMTPFDRWKVTPIELEAVAPPTILAACEENPLQPLDPIMEESSYANDYNGSIFGGQESLANYSTYDAFFAQSMASYDTNMTSLLGAESISDTQFSMSSSLPGGLQPLHRDRRRRRLNPLKAQASKRASPPTGKAAKAKPFHCTFCTSSFSTKHDWARHEKSQHLSLETWVCCQNGGTITSSAGEITCAFCPQTNPDKQHLETHNYSACQVKEAAERTFYRKDHFMQHLRLTHDCKIAPKMEVWKSEIANVKSRCGFCDARFDSWKQREEHLAAHFKCRADMDEWTGDWGFEAHIAAMVERAPRAELLLEPMGGSAMGMQMPTLQTLPQKVLPPVPMFSQQETYNAAAMLNYELQTSGMMEFANGNGFQGFQGMEMGMPMGMDTGMGMGMEGQLPMVYDASALDAVAQAGQIGAVMGMQNTDMIDWAQYMA